MMNPDDYELIDLSVPLEDGAVSEPLKPKIRYTNHRKGFWQMKFLFGVKRNQLKRSGERRIAGETNRRDPIKLVFRSGCPA